MLSTKNPKSDSKRQFSEILRASVSEKLREYLCGDDPELQQYNNDAIQDLTEYVAVLISNGKTQNQANTKLEPFLGDANSDLFVSWLWNFLSENSIDLNASSEIENANADGNAYGKKQASRSNIINSSYDTEQLSEGVKCPDDKDVSSESLEEGELPRTDREYIKEFEVSKVDIHGESYNCSSRGVKAYSGDLRVGGEESIQHDNFHTRSRRFRKLDVANVAGRRLFSRAAADAILHQHARVRNVWDRLGKLPEDGSCANAKMKGVGKIKEEAFTCDGESTEQNQSTHSLHGHKLRGRMSENFDIKPEASKKGQKRQFNTDIKSYQSDVSDSMDEEEAFIKKPRRLLPKEDNDVLSENCVSSGAGAPKSQKMGNSSGSDDSTSSKLKKMPKERLTGEFLESPVTEVSYSTPVTTSPSCKDTSNGTTNLNPVHNQLVDMKLRLQQLETEIFKLQSTQVEKKDQSSSKSGSVNHLERGESRTVVVTNMHIAATREAIRSYFAKCGAVDRVVKLTDSVGNKQKTYAYVTFTSKHSADRALALSGKSFFSRVIWVRRTGKLLQKSRCTPIGRRYCSTPTAPTYNSSRRPARYTL